MDIVKILGIGLISVIISIILKQYRPEFAIYISIITGIIIVFLVINKLNGVINLLKELSNKSSSMNGFLGILIKITGIAFLTEFASSICKDAGESAIASKIDFGGRILIISMSVPIISALLETVLKILP